MESLTPEKNCLSIHLQQLNFLYSQFLDIHLRILVIRKTIIIKILGEIVENDGTGTVKIIKKDFSCGWMMHEDVIQSLSCNDKTQLQSEVYAWLRSFG